MADEPEHTDSGQPVYRHKDRERGFEFAAGDEDTIAAVEAHLTAHLAKPARVFHELVSDLVHLDVHIVEPGDGRPFYTLMTSGMSDRPMTVPDGAEDFRYSELVCFLPPDWPLDWDSVLPGQDDPPGYWPVHGLKSLARLPHGYDTWLGFGHSVPNGDPPRELADGVGFTGFVLVPPVLAGEGFRTFTTPDGRTVHVYNLIPLYTEEMDLKLKGGVEAVLERFDRAGVSDVITVGRPNVADKPRKRWLPW